MQTMLQLNPHVPVLTPKGSGSAFMVIDYSQEHHLLWVVALDENGEIWTLPNWQVRFDKNISMERYQISEIQRSEKQTAASGKRG